MDASGAGQGAILNEDGTVNSDANPAAKGSIIVLFATGDGVESPAQPDGTLSKAPYPRTTADVQVAIGQKAADILYAGAAPTLVAGVMQVNARIPARLAGERAGPHSALCGWLARGLERGSCSAGRSP